MAKYIKDWQPRITGPIPVLEDVPKDGAERKQMSDVPKKKKPPPLPVFAPIPGSGGAGDQADGFGISKREAARRKRKGGLRQ